MGAGRAIKAQQSKSDGKQSARLTRQASNRSTNSAASKPSSSKALTKAAKPKAVNEREPVEAESESIASVPDLVLKAQPEATVANEAIIMNSPVATDAKSDKNEPVQVITWDDPKLDRKIIEGMLTDRNSLLNELATQGITSAAVMRRAADLGLSEAYLRHVQTVAADLAGDRPGARRVPSSLAARDCLSCNRVFLSSGPGNRICPRCRGADAGLAQL